MLNLPLDETEEVEAEEGTDTMMGWKCDPILTMQYQA